MAKGDTRTRILVTSLLLFNEHGEANTTTNDIADETDISPGNLHYHFRRKSDIVDALILEFQADARQVLQAPSGDDTAIDEFWGFLQLLIEVLAAYRFLIRDAETMVSDYPQVARAIKGFAGGLLAVIELHIHAMSEVDIVDVPEDATHDLSRSIAIVTLFSRRFDSILGRDTTIEQTVSHITSATIGLLLPYASPDSAEPLQAILEHYRH